MLNPTDAERAEARAALLKVLPTTAPQAVDRLVETLPALSPTDAERAEVRTALLKILPTFRSWTLGRLVSDLRSVFPTSVMAVLADRQQRARNLDPRAAYTIKSGLRYVHELLRSRVPD